MNVELKKAIFNHMVGDNDFQIVNHTVDKFKQYIYVESGDYCICGEEVMSFIRGVNKLLSK